MPITAELVPEERSSTRLASNNPFRNKINGSSTTATASKPAAAFSNNPFLDSTEVSAKPATLFAAPAARPSPTKGATDAPTDLLSGLTLNGKPTTQDRAAEGSLNKSSGSRGENLPPALGGKSSAYRPAPSDEERRTRDAKARVQKTELDIFADPPSEKKVPRRNSESSVRDKTSSLDREEEKKRRERRHREHKQGRPSRKASKKLDVIDRLDVTSIYGGGLFHHDGPFDACNPHRNRKGARAAPMQAFPEGSLNMQLGGAGPVQKTIDIDQYHGRGQEAHGDYNEAAVVDEEADESRRGQSDRAAFNPLQRSEPVHGSETAGLGTSTFLEGTPASRAAIERRESEYEQQVQQQGLARKKSLAQRIRRNRANTADLRVSSESHSPAPGFEGERRGSSSRPFQRDRDQDYEKKGTQIAFAEEELLKKPGRGRAPGSPRREYPPPTLYRAKTSDSLQSGGGLAEDARSAGSGFLSRVKSLKGGRRARSERRDVGG